MIRDNRANYVRLMHVAPQRVDSDAGRPYGIVQICSAGDKERDAVGRQWEQRPEVMRDTIIYFRNSPSILFCEAGNTVVTVEHMQQMVALRKQWDPEGGRVMGARRTEHRDHADRRVLWSDDRAGPADRPACRPDRDIQGIQRATARSRAADRDRGLSRGSGTPVLGRFFASVFRFQEGTERHLAIDVRELGAGLAQTMPGLLGEPDFDAAHSKWSGYASICFSDSDADGRQDSSEVCRVSGKLDAVRLPKEIYFAHRVVQNEQPDLHILGHRSYPADRKTVKTINVIANTQSVELFVNGKSAGVNSQPVSGYIFAFPDVESAPGCSNAVGRVGGKTVAQEDLATARPPAQIELTPIMGPDGLQAYGQDATLIDVEVVDAKAQRCPTDDDRVDSRLRDWVCGARLQQRQGRFDLQSVSEYGGRDQLGGSDHDHGKRGWVEGGTDQDCVEGGERGGERNARLVVARRTPKPPSVGVLRH